MIRILSDGVGLPKGHNIGLVDERSEIAAMYHGISQNDVGLRTDIMNHCKKSVGIRMMIRSMAPSIVATDEVGGMEDLQAIREAQIMGVKLLLTAHGNDITDVPKEFMKNHLFRYVILLQKEPVPGTIKKIWTWEGDKYVLCS